MFRYGVVDSTSFIVINVIIWDGQTEWTPPDGTLVIQDDNVGIGDIYDTNSSTFSRPTDIQS